LCHIAITQAGALPELSAHSTSNATCVQGTIACAALCLPPPAQYTEQTSKEALHVQNREAGKLVAAAPLQVANLANGRLANDREDTVNGGAAVSDNHDQAEEAKLNKLGKHMQFCLHAHMPL
jgi:hypothetical protein